MHGGLSAAGIEESVQMQLKNVYPQLYYGETVQSVSKLFLSSAAFSATLYTITFLNVSYEVHAYRYG